MSAPEQLGSLQQVANAVDPQSSLSINDKISILRAFSATIQEQLNLQQSQHVLHTISLQSLYYLFSYEDDTLTLIVCDLINKLLSPLSYEQIVSSENKEFLLEGLRHFTPSIRYLSLQQVYKCLASENATQHMVQSDIFPLILATIAFQDIKTANKASDLLYQLAKSSTIGQEAFFSPTCQAMLQQLLQITSNNGVISFRVYDLIIKVATLSDATFQQVENSGLLKTFTEDLATDDLLVKINAIELLSEIAATSAGVAFLERAQLLPEIAQVLGNDDENSDIAVQLVKAAVIKFLGNLGENMSVDFSKLETKYHFLERLEHIVDNGSNVEILTVTVSTVGLLGSHATGLRLLSQQTSLLKKCLELYESAVGSLKAVLLQTVSKLLSVRDGTEDIKSLTYQVYDQIPGRPSQLDSLIKEAKQPDDSVRIAALAAMQAIAYHQWGLKAMARSSEFMEYIMNRSTEYTEQGQSWKYVIVQTMASAPDAMSIFGNSYYAQLQVYIRQGAHYRYVEPSAAVENS